MDFKMETDLQTETRHHRHHRRRPDSPFRLVSLTIKVKWYRIVVSPVWTEAPGETSSIQTLINTLHPEADGNILDPAK